MTKGKKTIKKTVEKITFVKAQSRQIQISKSSFCLLKKLLKIRVVVLVCVCTKLRCEAFHSYTKIVFTDNDTGNLD